MNEISPSKHESLRIFILLLFVSYVIVLLKTAWLCDDAYITFRTVDNFVNGYGLRWNIEERVQSFTNPLMMFSLSLFYFFTGEIYYTSIFFTIIISTIAVLFMWKNSASNEMTIVGLLILITSNSFVDFSTSGLENPLSNLLIGIFAWLFLQPSKLSLRSYSQMLFVSSLLMLNRMDTILFIFPALVYSGYILYSSKEYSIPMLFKKGLIAFSPFIIWELFSLFYYGFPFPNTAYAKLGTGISSSEYAKQGLLYLLNSLQHDPITIIFIITGLISAYYLEDRKIRMLGIGLLLYFLYVIKIGGDFMSGRFLNTQIYMAVLILSRLQIQTPQIILFAISIFFISSNINDNPWSTSRDYGNKELYPDTKVVYGIANERQYYFQKTGLIQTDRTNEMPLNVSAWLTRYKSKEDTPKYLVRMCIGFVGFFMGRDYYIIDELALSDPLLARLPSVAKKNWRIGHFEREIPAGYLKTLETGEDHFEDKNLGLFYQKLQIMTRGPLFNFERFKTIILMNLGHYNHLIDHNRYRYKERKRISFSELFEEKTNRVISTQGLIINLEEKISPQRMLLSISNHHNHHIEFYKENETIGKLFIKKSPLTQPFTFYDTLLPKDIADEGFDSILVYSDSGKISEIQSLSFSMEYSSQLISQ